MNDNDKTPLIAFVLVPIAALAAFLWIIGAGLRKVGIELYMFCHKLARKPGCRCEECVEFDPCSQPPNPCSVEGCEEKGVVPMPRPAQKFVCQEHI